MPFLAVLLILGISGVMLSSWQRGAAAANGDGLLFYGASANTTPQSRMYTANDSFAAAAGTVAGTQAQTVVVKTSPTKFEAIAGYVDASGVLQVMCYDGVSWSNEWTVTVGGNGTTRRFDIAYEKTSGKAMVLYGANGANLGYRTKANADGCGGANWAAATTFTPSRTTGTIAWVKIDQNPTASSNLLAAAWADTNSDLSSRIWSGSAWGQEPTAVLEATLEFASAAQDIDSFDIEYESTSGDLMVTWGQTGGAAVNLIEYAVCTGNTSTCTWNLLTDATNNIPTVADGATIIDIAADPASDQISLVAADNSGAANSCDMSTAVWSGSAWTGVANVDATIECPTAGMQLVSTFWLNNGATKRRVVLFDDASGTGLSWITYNGGTVTVQTDFAATPAINDVRSRYESYVDPFTTSQGMTVLTDSTGATFAKRLSMDAAGAFTWTNADGGASLGTVSQAAVGDFSFSYWNYIPPIIYTQSAYRLYNNTDTTDVGTVLANQDTAGSLTSAGANFRLRLLIHMGANVSTSGKSFKLQYVGKGTGTCAAPTGGTPASYTDITTATAISYRNNATPADGASLTTNANDPTHSGHTIRSQTYEEANNFTNSVAAINNGEDGKWDFALYDNGAPAGSTYCIRAIESDGSTDEISHTVYPEITTYSSVVTIDSLLENSVDNKTYNGTDTVFVSDSVGYTFYRDSDDNCKYAKTTNGGATWAAPVTVFASLACAKAIIWYDQWTPGNTGTKIHIVTIDTVDLYYNSLETSGGADTLGATTAGVNITTDKTNTFGANSARPTITQSTTGVLYVGVPDAGGASDESYVKKCSATCTTAGNWTDASTGDTFVAHSELLLMPLPSGNIMLIYRNLAADDMLSKVYNGSTWDVGWTTIDSAAPESTDADYRGSISATVDTRTNTIYLAYVADNDVLGTDDDIRTASYSSSTWTAKTGVLVNDARGIGGATIAFDHNTGALYVAYRAQSTPGTNTTTQIFWKKSTDGMTSWGSESSAIAAAEATYGLHMNVTSDERLYLTWQNAAYVLYGSTIADLTPPSYSQTGFRLFQNANSTTAGTALAAQNTNASLTASGDSFRLKLLLNVVGDGIRASLHDFKLQYVGKGSGTCAAPSGGTPASYTDVTAATLIAYKDNGSVADGATTTGGSGDLTNGGNTIIDQTYEELNNFTNGAAAIANNQDGKWDFSLIDNGAAASTAYCLRVVKSDGTVLGSYSQYPQITTGTAAPPNTDNHTTHLRGGQAIINGVKNPFSF